MKTQTLILICLVSAFVLATPTRGDFFVIKKFENGSQATTTVPDEDDFTVQVDENVRSVQVFSNATQPSSENLGKITIQRTIAEWHEIWIYIVASSNPQPGNSHFLLTQAACGNWKGIQESTSGGGLRVRAVIAGNLTGSIAAPNGAIPGGVENVLVGAAITGGISFGSLGTCRIRSISGIVGPTGNTIQSAAGILEVRVDNGHLFQSVQASGGAINAINVINGDIGDFTAGIPITNAITATAGIVSLTASGSISANITADGNIGAFDAGLDYRGTMTLSGFTTFHIGRDLRGAGIINFTSAIPADRILEIDRSTISPSQINLPPSLLLGQIDINRDNGGGAWGGTVKVGTTTLTDPGYVETAASLGGGSVGKVPFGLHDESCTPANGAVKAATACLILPEVSLRHYGLLNWNGPSIPVLVYGGVACSGNLTQITTATFALDPNDGRTLKVTFPFKAGYQYKITPNGVLQCATPGNPSVVWEIEYMFRVQSHCPADIAGGADPASGASIPDGVVNIDDLLRLINAWGACPNLTPPCCVADIAGADGWVNIDDLLALINTWGPCATCDGQGDSFPQTVQGCMDKCGSMYPEGGTEFSQCLNSCVQALCEAQIISCD